MFYKISKPAAYLLIPQFFWVTFAGYLNLAIYTIQKQTLLSHLLHFFVPAAIFRKRRFLGCGKQHFFLIYLVFVAFRLRISCGELIIATRLVIFLLPCCFLASNLLAESPLLPHSLLFSCFPVAFCLQICLRKTHFCHTNCYFLTFLLLLS